MKTDHAGPIDVEGDAAADGEVEIAHGRTASHTGDELGHVERIAAVQLPILTC